MTVIRMVANGTGHSTRWDEAADGVVVGSGFAGLAAAIEARLAGRSVVVLEKMRACGGNSIIAGGLFAAAGTSLQARLGVSDSAESLYRDMLRAGLGLNHPELARIVAERSAEIWQWTVDLGVRYRDELRHLGGHSAPRSHVTSSVSGSPIIRQQLARVRSLGATVRLGVYLHRLLQGADGRVQGVLVHDGYRYPAQGAGRTAPPPPAVTERTLQAGKAVVLATGGFANDLALRAAQDPRLTAEVDTTAKQSTTGEGLKEALRAGAMPVHLDWIQLAPWTSPDEKGDGAAGQFADVAFEHGIIVDPTTGRRCINELGDRRTVADAILAVGRPPICLADAGGVARSGLPIERCLRKGVARRFDGVGELAEAYGIPPDELQATVERYNRAVRAGIDPEFSKPFHPGVAPLDHPPFYGMRLWPKVHHTMGGVQINTQAQVLDLEQRPIPGLYAAGEVTGGIHGACRLGSCAITECLIFGRIAGRSAAQE